MTAGDTIQDRRSLEDWYASRDPWGYETNPNDAARKSRLLAELPARRYGRVLDIGCGHGFVTRDLPGDEVIGVDLSSAAIAHASASAGPRLRYLEASIFGIERKVEGRFDLIVITGVLYPQYVGRALSCVYRSVNQLLAEGGILACVHIDDWYHARFPLLRLREHLYAYREYTHRLELYAK